MRNFAKEILTFSVIKPNGEPDITNILLKLEVPPLSMDIDQGARMDTGKVSGRSGNQKQSTGYEDASIDVKLVLQDEELQYNEFTKTALEKVEEIQRLFKDHGKAISKSGSSNKTVPRAYAIQSRLTDALDIKTVVIKTLKIQAVGSGKTDIKVSMKLVEFEPVIVHHEKWWGYEDDYMQQSVFTNEEEYYTGTESDFQSIDYTNGDNEELGVTDPFSKGLLAAKEDLGGK